MKNPKIDFNKADGLVPAIVQDVNTDKVLMLGYMNEEAFSLTVKTKKITFYSRSKKRIWTKGETSGNYLNLISYSLDCDQDALLFKVKPEGNTCHTGNYSCFGEQSTGIEFINLLSVLIKNRKKQLPNGSYTTKLFQKGVKKIAQKVGEEAVEVILEASNDNKYKLIYESADLLYHLMVLLEERDVSIFDVVKELQRRSKT